MVLNAAVVSRQFSFAAPPRGWLLAALGAAMPGMAWF